MSDLRPTLFLAQLSNLLAGNISIVHGVTGSSRTFMGEESAGVDAVRIALARIAAGQSDIALVGGAYNGERARPADALRVRRPRSEGRVPRRCGSAATRAASRSARSAPSWCSKRASTPRRAAPSRWRGFPPCSSDRSQARRPARSTAALARHVGQAQAPRSTAGHAAVHLRRQRRRARHRRGARLPRRRMADLAVRATGILSRAWARAAIPHEYRAGRAGARPW